MNVEVFDNSRIVLSLSRNNLEALLHMLDNPIHQIPSLTRTVESGQLLVVLPQENKEHYGSREVPMGKMSWEHTGKDLD